MRLEIEYRNVVDVINLIDKLKLKGIQSIHRTRLSRKLQERLEGIAEEQLEIQKQYFDVDKDGNPIVDMEKCKNTDEYVKTMSDFVSEKVVIEDSESQTMLKSLKESLENSDIEWSSKEAYTFEYLYTQLESSNETDEVSE